MKELKLLTLVSIDGFSSRLNGCMDWVCDRGKSPLEQYDFASFFESIDCVVMNRMQYMSLRLQEYAWPIRDKQCFVLTGKGMPIPIIDGALRLNLLTADEERGKGALPFVHELQQSPGEGGIWVMGDHRLTGALMQNDMIDEINVLRIPIILGSGLPFSGDLGTETHWSLVKSVEYPNGAIHSCYHRLGQALAV
jgi:dihydrofolate reductase